MAAAPGEVLSFIEELGRGAGEILRGHFRKELAITRKRDDSFVTNADLASEAYIIERIRGRFPADTICSEEAGLSSAERQPGTYIWIIDPLDGTTNFANHYDFFCVSIARGRFEPSGLITIEQGVVYDPVRQRSYAAELGRGAWVNGEPLRVNKTKALKDAFLVTGFYYNSGIDLKKDILTLYEVATRCNGIRRDGAAALDMALVAEGIYDAFWEWGLQPWDVAAGQLLVKEAGGTLENYPGPKDADFNVEDPGVICGVSEIVKALSVIIRRESVG